MGCGASSSAPGQIYEAGPGGGGKRRKGVAERGTELEPDEAAVATYVSAFLLQVRVLASSERQCPPRHTPQQHTP